MSFLLRFEGSQNRVLEAHVFATRPDYSPKAHLPEICICKNKVPFLAACYKRLSISPTDMKLQLNFETNLLHVKYAIL